MGKNFMGPCKNRLAIRFSTASPHSMHIFETSQYRFPWTFVVSSDPTQLSCAAACCTDFVNSPVDTASRLLPTVDTVEGYLCLAAGRGT